ncbi:MAG TPA: TonB-dependent receptor plug domain-containing protein, partial [Bacteroidales bacterium]|nr:TonB-dependent receptor plug domain-containing protein [Bacteroidales bacterium]
MTKRLFLFLSSMLFIINTTLAQVNVSGTVTDASDGTGIPYATVMVKGTSIATMADIKGAYSLNKVPSNAILVFSSIGYQTIEIPVEGRSIVNAVMSQQAVGLDEVMVVAYGSVKKGSYSGSATMIKGDAIKDIPVMTFEQAITGAVPGVSIAQTSGQPGGLPEIRIRGFSSFNAGNDPLYVIDGIPATSGDLSSANIWSSTMNYLNPSDIETITILKDAAAASLYGSRAANGVILITTKKGQVGKIVSTFKASVGVSYFAYNNYPLANDQEAEMLHREAWTNYANDNPSSWASYGSISAYVNTKVEQYYPAKKEGYQYVDWEDVLFRNAISQNYEYSISGGGPFSKTYASVGYNEQQGVNVMENLKRISATINAEAQASKHIKVGGSFQFSSTNQKG